MSEQEANVIFLPNLAAVSVAISVCQFYFGDLRLILTLTAAFLLYLASCNAALHWCEYMRGVFDLYQLDLLKQLGVHLAPQPMTLRTLQETWQRVQTPLLYGLTPQKELTFDPRTWTAAEMLAAEAGDRHDAPSVESTIFSLGALGFCFVLSRSPRPSGSPPAPLK